jgi:exosortase A-associated hydrolase 2
VTRDARSEFEPLFIEGGAGRIFGIYHPPRGGTIGGAALYVPPFAEEMNRSRRVAALFARRAAGLGCGTLILDLFGCGDSDGGSGDARWEIWRDDVRAGIEFLLRRGHGRVTLVGLRLGALLALDAAAEASSVDRVLLWQPVLRGDQMVTQFLRLRLAADLAGAKTGGESTATMRARLTAGESLEIAGYEVAPALAQAIDGLRLEQLGDRCGRPIEWVAIDGPASTPSSAPEKILEGWRERQVTARLHRVVAEPFWTLQETTLAPALVARSAELFASGPA